MFLAFPLFFLWLAVVSVMVRPFGVWLPLGPLSFAKRKIAFQALTFTQHLIIRGVLLWGCGVFIVIMFSHYLEWKYFHGSSDSLTAGNLLWRFVTYPLVGGVLFGLISWNGRSAPR